MKKWSGLILLLLLLSTKFISAQTKTNVADTIVNAKLLHFTYGYALPFGDLADRFGSNHLMGASLFFKMKDNYLLGFEGNLIFGGNIKEDTIIDGLLTSQGFLIGVNGLAESAYLYERGYTLFVKFGKLIPAFGSNPNSGINFNVGAGFMQHKIKIQDPDKVLPYVTGEYAKGYDRLTNGFALTQYIGYQNLDKRKRINFNAGIEFNEAFTQNRRDWNTDQMKKDDAKRFDMLIGLKFSWILPFYGKGESRIYTH
ncbi:MAG: hypothetical protein LH473_01865 [Chitinophagales bacterium]|nr:hypothetical protein [Chitinophagales bacterium]